MSAIDLPGNNINDGWNTHVSSREECAALCDANPNCLAATYVVPGIQGPEGHCWLKNPVPAEQENFNTYSFYKLLIATVTICTAPAPVAEFTAYPPSGQAPFGVMFTDQSSGAVSWAWDFGDGATSAEQNPTHIYHTGSQAGTPYTVKLTVADACAGRTDTKIRTGYITVYDSLGGLIVSSVPAGARILLDSQDLGTTPYKNFVPSGTHTLRLTMSGYEDHIATITITKNQKTTVTATLVPLAATASPATTTTGTPSGVLQVTTIPDGATVYVDGGSQGLSPITLSAIAPGSHAVKLTKAGYIDYEGTVTVQSGQMTPLSVKLVSGTAGPAFTGTTAAIAAANGSLWVMSTPAGAGVNLDGWEKGTTPLTLSDVKAGSHILTLKKAGYRDSVLNVTVPAGSAAQVNISLVPAGQVPLPSYTGGTRGFPLSSGTGTLTVSSVPPGASVYLDGSKAGTTPLTIPDVSPGTHRLLLTLRNHEDISRIVEVTAGTDTPVSVGFPAEKTPGFGILLPPAALALAALAAAAGKNRIS